MQRPGFTLVEVLIAVILIGMIVPALFETTTLLEKSNRQLKAHLQKVKLQTKALKVLYDDIATSDGNITIGKNEYDRLCIARTSNTLYNLGMPSVCWGVTKSSKTLVRLEGVRWPLRIRENGFAYADEVAEGVKLFEVSYNPKTSEVLVVFEASGMEPVAFAVYGITPPPKPKPEKKRVPNRKKVRHKAKPSTPLEVQ